MISERFRVLGFRDLAVCHWHQTFGLKGLRRPSGQLDGGDNLKGSAIAISP